MPLLQISRLYQAGLSIEIIAKVPSRYYQVPRYFFTVLTGTVGGTAQQWYGLFTSNRVLLVLLVLLVPIRNFPAWPSPALPDDFLFCCLAQPSPTRPGPARPGLARPDDCFFVGRPGPARLSKFKPVPGEPVLA